MYIYIYFMLMYLTDVLFIGCLQFALVHKRRCVILRFRFLLIVSNRTFVFKQIFIDYYTALKFNGEFSDMNLPTGLWPQETGHLCREFLWWISHSSLHIKTPASVSFHRSNGKHKETCSSGLSLLCCPLRGESGGWKTSPEQTFQTLTNHRRALRSPLPPLQGLSRVWFPHESPAGAYWAGE